MVILVRLMQLALVGLTLCFAGCASRGSPVVSDHSPVFGNMPAVYQVRPGDTLYSIAWRYGLDVVELARINNIKQPFTIFPNQAVALREQHKSAPPLKTKSKSSPTPTPTPSTSKPPVAAVKPSSSKWAWPVKLTPLLKFGERGSGGISHGIDYELPNRTRVRAAAAGKVVYAGPGLGGFERLIILEHGQAILSAYGFHGQTRVQEQQIVKVGAELADTLGSSAEFSRFHFEVRKHGRPVDPKRLILR